AYRAWRQRAACAGNLVIVVAILVARKQAMPRTEVLIEANLDSAMDLGAGEEGAVIVGGQIRGSEVRRGIKKLLELQGLRAQVLGQNLIAVKRSDCRKGI